MYVECVSVPLSGRSCESLGRLFHVFLTITPRKSWVRAQMARGAATTRTVSPVAATGVVVVATPIAQASLVHEQEDYLPAGKLSSRIHTMGHKVVGSWPTDAVDWDIIYPSVRPLLHLLLRPPFFEALLSSYTARWLSFEARGNTVHPLDLFDRSLRERW